MKNKTYVFTMVYCGPDMFRAGMESFKRTVDPDSFTQHVLLDQHYPLRSEGVSQAIEEYVAGAPYPVLVLDAGHNLGLHEGLNYMLDQIGPLDQDDLIVAYDCDEYPERAGWVEAMQRVMVADPACGWLSLNTVHIEAELTRNAVLPSVIAGETIQVPESALMNVLCCWRAGAIQKAGGKFTEPFSYYGGLEQDMQPKFKAAGYWVGWLSKWYTYAMHDTHDPEYTLYKKRHVGFIEPRFEGSFEEFLRV